ncbi:MAG: DUF2203 domain-containing protein, partial [bacterium]
METSGSFEKLFTLEEARGLIPALRPRMQRMRRLWDQIQPHKEEAERAAKRVDLGGERLPGGGSYLPLVEELKFQLAFFQKAGVEVKSLPAGLVDFPSEREGRVVYLCWHVEEETVSHWHELDAGFVGRRA